MTITRRQRGRKSAAALSTAVTFPIAIPRLPPPAELTGEECETWVAVTDAMPADWFSPAAVPLLVQLCRHTTQARRIAELIERAAGDRETELSYYADLLRMQRTESAAIASLSTKLRISPAALRNDRGHLQHSRPGPAPWDEGLLGGRAIRPGRR